MKRGSPMRRSKPLRAKLSAFAQFVELTTPHALWPKPRRPLKKRGARSAREAGAIKAFRDVTLARAAGECERCRTPQRSLEVHHLTRRARAVGWPDLHNPEINSAAVCHACHVSLTLDPMDVGGPLEHEASRSHEAFNAWRAKSGTPPDSFLDPESSAP